MPPASTRPEARRRLAVVILLGLVVLGVGYAIFVTNDHFYFSAAGITNRVTQIGSLGVAIALAGLFGLAGTLATRPRSSAPCCRPWSGCTARPAS